MTVPGQNRIFEFSLVALLLLLFLGLSLAFISTQYVTTKESTAFLVAKNFLSDPFYSQNDFAEKRAYVQNPPLFSYLVSVSFYFLGKTFFAGRVVSVFFASATILLVYLHTRRGHPALISLAAALAFASMPIMFNYGLRADREIVLAFFCFLSLCLITGKSDRAPFYAGVALGLGFLVKHPAVLVFIAFFLVSFVRDRKKALWLSAGFAPFVLLWFFSLFFIDPGLPAQLFSFRLSELLGQRYQPWAEPAVSDLLSRLVLQFSPILVSLSLLGIFLSVFRRDRHFELAYFLSGFLFFSFLSGAKEVVYFVFVVPVASFFISDALFYLRSKLNVFKAEGFMLFYSFLSVLVFSHLLFSVSAIMSSIPEDIASLQEQLEIGRYIHEKYPTHYLTGLAGNSFSFLTGQKHLSFSNSASTDIERIGRYKNAVLYVSPISSLDRPYFLPEEHALFYSYLDANCSEISISGNYSTFLC